MVITVYVRMISRALDVLFMLVYKLKILYNDTAVESDYQSVIS